MVAAGRNARLGMKLFIVYLAVYVNLAVAYGFGLIVLALLMALAYGWLCRVIAPVARKDGK